MNNLVRWKADPNKIRVSILQVANGSWLAKVTHLKSGKHSSFTGRMNTLGNNV